MGKLAGGWRIRNRHLHVQTSRPYLIEYRCPRRDGELGDEDSMLCTRDNQAYGSGNNAEGRSVQVIRGPG